MRLKLYRAPTVAAAMAQVREELGADALILATRRVAGGVELTAAGAAATAGGEQLGGDEAAGSHGADLQRASSGEIRQGSNLRGGGPMLLVRRVHRDGRRTTVTKKSSIARTAATNCSKSTGLRTYAFACRS